MTQIDSEEYIPTERVAIIVWRLRDGEQLSTAEIAAAVGLNLRAAQYMMAKLSRVLPLRYHNGLWEIM